MAVSEGELAEWTINGSKEAFPVAERGGDGVFTNVGSKLSSLTAVVSIGLCLRRNERRLRVAAVEGRRVTSQQLHE